MSDFLSKLIARSFSDAPAIQPRVPSLFEPTAVEFLDEPQSPTPTIAAPEIIAPTPTIGAHETSAATNAPAPVPSKLSPREETAITRSVANVPDAVTEEHPPKADTPAHQPAPAQQNAPVIAQVRRPSEQTAEVRKLEVETRRIIVPVRSFRDGKKDTGDKKPPPEALSAPRPIQPQRQIQPRRRKDFSPVEQRSSTSAPIIRVTIGRVEVRGIHSPAPAPKPAKPAPPKLSLEDYLRKRGRDSR